MGLAGLLSLCELLDIQSAFCAKLENEIQCWTRVKPGSIMGPQQHETLAGDR